METENDKSGMRATEMAARARKAREGMSSHLPETTNGP